MLNDISSFVRVTNQLSHTYANTFSRIMKATNQRRGRITDRCEQIKQPGERVANEHRRDEQISDLAKVSTDC